MVNQKCIDEWQANFGYWLLKEIRTSAFEGVSPQFDQ